MDNIEPLVVEYQMPSVKDQIVSASVGIGVSLAASAILLGGLAAVGAVSNKIRDRKAKKLAQKDSTNN